MEEQLKKQIEELKKENEQLKRSRNDLSAFEATIKELYAALGSRKINVKVLQKKNGIPYILKVVSMKIAGDDVYVEVAE